MIGAGATSGGAMDASNLLKPALASGNLRCIGSTTYKEYRQFFEKDRALVRRFQKIDVNEPSLPDTIEILKGLKPYYEEHHKVRYTNEAIKAAVELSARYINDRKLPDKAIDVIDESGASQMLLPEGKRKKTIGIKDIEATVATMARIPPKSVSKDDAEVLQHLDLNLKRVVFGQDKAIDALVLGDQARARRPARAGKADRLLPLLRPDRRRQDRGREAARRADGRRLLRFDMSEYMERHTVSRLIGAPPGYVGFDQGGLLTDGVDQTPHCVLLLDEIEKAHPDLFNILLQVMDHGKLTDHNGKQVDFRNVILIMTTNAGASEMAKAAIGFGNSKRDRRRRGGDQPPVHAGVPQPPRRDDRVRLAAAGSRASGGARSSCCSSRRSSPTAASPSSSTTKATAWLAERGYDERMGARPLGRLIQEVIKKPLADEVLFGKLQKGGVVKVSVEDEGRRQAPASSSSRSPTRTPRARSGRSRRRAARRGRRASEAAPPSEKAEGRRLGAARAA